jgi:hypothetical protein
MLYKRIVHQVAPFGHCASICSAQDKIWLTYYQGPECSNQQRVIVDCFDNDIKIASKRFAPLTGNCVLIPKKTGVKIIVSKFEDIDSNDNTPQSPVERWMFCSNWACTLSLSDGVIKNTRPIRIPLHPAVGYLTRCNPINHNDQWLLPLYREHNCHGLILASKDTNRWVILGTIGRIDNISNDRFGSGILIQPTLWHDGIILHSLSRDVSRNRLAWYSKSINDGKDWSMPMPSKISNYNNSLVMVHDNTSEPWLIWNYGASRLMLTLGKWQPNTLSAIPILKLNLSSSASYPNYCFDNQRRLHIVHSDSGPIIQHIFDQEMLTKLTKLAGNKILNIEDINKFT